MLREFPAFLCGPLALADLFQIPLVTAIALAISWRRRWPRAWVAVSAAAACWAGWILIVGLFVPFSPSSYLLITAGVVVDPWGKWDPAANHVRVMVIGVASILVGAWGVPTFVAWGISRLARRPARPAAAVRPSWRNPAILLLALIAAQGLLLGIAQYVRATSTTPVGMFRAETGYCSGALALIVPIVGAAVATAYRAVRYGIQQPTTPAPARPWWRGTAARVVLVGLVLGFAVRSGFSFRTTCGRTPPPAVRTELNGR
jgi:hypothetical protein